MLLNSIFANSDIHKLLTQLGADLHYIGYRYEYALLLIKEDEQCIHSVTK
nr:MAG TPA: Sporulation initiation factor Spo0A C terminal [Bacteriophage sp.]DAZ75713.1 MAG TPA: Sporulation initiation factor Spo0A C terminal [Caudoviricetes sp.]